MNPLHTPLVPFFIAGMLGLAAVPGAGLMSPAVAQTAPIQTQETNYSGVTAELIECRRKDGVLTIRLRLRNTSDKDASFNMVGANYDVYYVTGGTKKYFILRDTEKSPLATARDVHGQVNARLPKGGTYVFWAKYPAPPADVKKINYVTPLGSPFEDVPITD